MRKVFIDTNIVLDLALERDPFTVNAHYIFDSVWSGKIQGYISASSVTDISYVLIKAQGKAGSLMFLRELVRAVTTLNVSSEIINEALYSEFTDFEDAVQYHTALANGMDIIVTRDTTGFLHSRIPVYSPEKLCAEMKAAYQNPGYN